MVNICSERNEKLAAMELTFLHHPHHCNSIDSDDKQFQISVGKGQQTWSHVWWPRTANKKITYFCVINVVLTEK